MFRENVLTRDEIIDRIAATMVPVALDYQQVLDPDTPEAKLLRPLLAQRDQDQGLWIFSPDGRALGGFVGFGDMVGQTQQTIEDALTAFGPVKPRRVPPVDTQPHRGRGVLPDGGVCLAVYLRTSDDALRFVNAKSPVISSVTLSAREFRAFAPPAAVAGTKWTLPDDVSKRLSRISSPMCYQHAPQPDWVTGVRITARVQAIRDGIARIEYAGRIASEHRVRGEVVSAQETKLTGEGAYDLETGQMQSVLLIGAGTLQWPEAPEKVVEFDALVEWEREPAAAAAAR